MIKMVVFDMAGTTVDENNVVYKTLQKVINQAGFDFSLQQVLAAGAGKEKSVAIKDIVALSNKPVEESFINDLYNNFVQELAVAYENFDLQPQPGTEEVFKKLREKDILVVLNTGYNKTTATFILQKLGWKTGFQVDGLVTASDVRNNRPQPDMILLAMQQFDITDATTVIKVGDSIIDIEEGKNAGCAITVGVTTGAHTYEQLSNANPTAIINQLPELLHLI